MKKRHQAVIVVHIGLTVECESRVHAERVVENIERFYQQQPYRMEPILKDVRLDALVRELDGEPVPMNEDKEKTEVNP